MPKGGTPGQQGCLCPQGQGQGPPGVGQRCGETLEMTRPLGHKVQTLPSVTVAPRPKGVFAFSWLLNRQRCMFWKHQRVPLGSPPRTGPSLPS